MISRANATAATRIRGPRISKRWLSAVKSSAFARRTVTFTYRSPGFPHTYGVPEVAFRFLSGLCRLLGVCVRVLSHEDERLARRDC
jgi:hypothetical protein